MTALPSSNRALPLLLAFGLVAGPLLADEVVEKGAPPPPPFYKEAPSYAAWTVRVQQVGGTPLAKAAQGGPAKILALLEAAQAGTRRREISHWTDGTSSELWMYDGLILSENAVGGWVNIVDPKQLDEEESRWAQTDFSELLWLSADAYAGRAKRDGHDCCVYRQSGREAWIDAATGLPVVVRSGGRESLYEFGAPPTGPLTPSEKFQQPLENYLKALNAGAVYKMAPPPP